MRVSSRAGEVGSVGADPPGEFRVFSSGMVDTSHGSFLFDEQALRSVLDDYEAHGVDVMLDLEHLSLDTESRSFDPDARGWAKLEARNGELWAVGVTWTPDGATRLREKRQRYVSPTFEVDRETRRVLRLVNIAITALPATHGIAPLVAATGRDGMEDLKKIADALGCEATLEAVVAAVGALNRKIAEAAGSVPPTAPETPSTEATAEGTAPPGAEEDEDEKPVDAVATRRKLLVLTAGRTGAEALATVETWRKAFVQLSADRAQLAADRAKLDAAERHELVATMVKLGAEDPAGAWADLEAEAPSKPAEPWASMPLASLRARVERIRASRTGHRPPPRSPTAPVAGLSTRLAARAAALNVDPSRVAATLSAITGAAETA